MYCPLNDDCILLDSYSTTCILGRSVKHLLINFREMDKGVKIKCNGGIREVLVMKNFGLFPV